MLSMNSVTNPAASSVSESVPSDRDARSLVSMAFGPAACRSFGAAWPAG